MKSVRVVDRGGEGEEGAPDEGDDVLPNLSARLTTNVMHLKWITAEASL